MNNLEMIAAQRAQSIINATILRRDRQKPDKKDDVENVVTKALGVTQEQGIFACMLYLLSRSNKQERPIAEAVRGELVALLKDPVLHPFGLGYSGSLDDVQALLKHFAETVCASPIHTLLMVKDLFEQTLMYARYSAKAQPD